MEMLLEITGLNLERLLGMAAQAGILITHVKRSGGLRMNLRIHAKDKQRFFALCQRYGWQVKAVKCGRMLACVSWIMNRPMASLGAVLFVLLMALSSSMIWQVRIDHAGKSKGEISRFLSEAGIGPGCLKRSLPLADLREALLLRLPDLAHISAAYEGSRLVISCQQMLEGEYTEQPGDGLDLIAKQDGLVTGIFVKSGTPAVEVGQAVCAGDVLIRGEERTEKQGLLMVKAQGDVTARVWSRGDARVSRKVVRTVETGAVRKRVTVISPWHRRRVTDAAPFEKQDTSRRMQTVVGLYLPLVREIETLAEIETIQEERSIADATSAAEGAAAWMAKNKCPHGVHILDKSVENSIIDNEYVYAAVVLEYEDSIAVRADQASLICE